MLPDSPELTLQLIDALVRGGFINGASVLVDRHLITVDLTIPATTPADQVPKDILAGCPSFPPACQAALATALECTRGAEYWSLKFDFVTDEAASLVTLDADRLMKHD